MSGTKGNVTESQKSLEQALRTLRAIRQRYALERNTHPDARSFNMQVALGSADMFWITAVIESLEKTIASGTTETTGVTAQAPLKT